MTTYCSMWCFSRNDASCQPLTAYYSLFQACNATIILFGACFSKDKRQAQCRCTSNRNGIQYLFNDTCIDGWLIAWQWLSYWASGFLFGVYFTLIVNIFDDHHYHTVSMLARWWWHNCWFDCLTQSALYNMCIERDKGKEKWFLTW
jgi:hypothetical protein